MSKNDDVAFYVLCDDGTWAGGFSSEKEARMSQKQLGGQVVRGKWFITK